jgi:hypothetical protein
MTDKAIDIAVVHFVSSLEEQTMSKHWCNENVEKNGGEKKGSLNKLQGCSCMS